MDWLLFLHPVDARDYLLDATETVYALVPSQDIERLASPELRRVSHWHRYIDDTDDVDWRDDTAYTLWPEALQHSLRSGSLTLSLEQQLRKWQLFHWLDQPTPI